MSLESCIKKNLKRCTVCNHLFMAVWADQERCPSCQPLKIDPEKIKLINAMSQRFRSGLPH